MDEKFISERNSVAVLGKSNRLSPALFYWNIGPPKGYFHYIGTIDQKKYYLLKKADYLVLIILNNKRSDYEITQRYQNHSDHIRVLLDNNKIMYFDEFNMDSMNQTFHLYRNLRQP